MDILNEASELLELPSVSKQLMWSIDQLRFAFFPVDLVVHFPLWYLFRMIRMTLESINADGKTYCVIFISYPQFILW